MSVKQRLIIGLGNPGIQYVNTRHNLGYALVEAFAKECGIVFKNEKRFSGFVAKGSSNGYYIILLLPSTYMNLSGESVRKCLDFFKLKIEDLIVIADDVAIPFGSIRLKPQGSPGGHQGLRNIEQHLGSNQYVRLRLGIGEDKSVPLEKYVLNKFTKLEMAELDSFLDKGLQVLNLWLKEGIDEAMNFANTKQKSINKEEEDS